MRYFRTSLKQCLKSLWFYASILCSLVLLIQPVADKLFIYNISEPNVSIFGEALNFGFIVFVIPFLVSFPYAKSYIAECKDNYLDYIYCRTSKQMYAVSKIMASALIGGALCSIPLIGFGILASCGTCPVIMGEHNFVPLSSTLWGNIFDSHGGLLYFAGQAGLAFVFGAVWGIVGLSFAVAFKTIQSTIVGPFILYYGLLLFSQQLGLRFLDPSETLIVTNSNAIGFVGIGIYQLILVSLATITAYRLITQDNTKVVNAE